MREEESALKRAREKNSRLRCFLLLFSLLPCDVVFFSPSYFFRFLFSSTSSSFVKKKILHASKTQQGGLGTPGGGGRGRRGDSDAAASPSSVAGGVGGGVLLSIPTSARRGSGGATLASDDAEDGDDEDIAGPSSPEQRRQRRAHRGPPASWTRGELIGAGAFGRVYLGLDDETGELFAVKTVSLPSTVSFASSAPRGAGASRRKRNGYDEDDDLDFDDDEDDDDVATTTAASRAAARINDRRLAPHVEALRSEVELLAGLDHPNIVRYLGTEQRAALPEGCSSGGTKKKKGGGSGGSEGESDDDGGGENDGGEDDDGGDSPHSAYGTPKGKKSSSSSRLMKKTSSKGKSSKSAQSNLGSELNIFLEYVPGGSIAGLVARFGPLAERVSASYARQILTGLAYLHAHGIAHRDVKGANCLVGSQGVVKLADFGASKRIEDVATLGESFFFVVFFPGRFLRFFPLFLPLSLPFYLTRKEEHY